MGRNSAHRSWLAMVIGLTMLPAMALAGSDSEGGEGGGDHNPSNGPPNPPGRPPTNIFYLRQLTPDEVRKLAEKWAEDSTIDVMTLQQRMEWIQQYGYPPGYSPASGTFGNGVGWYFQQGISFLGGRQ